MDNIRKMIGIERFAPGHGAMIKGWDITEEWFRDKNKLPIVDLAVFTNACPRDCSFCFTDKAIVDLSLNEIKYIIDQLAERETYGIDFLGEGEPPLDKNFFEVIEYTTKKGIIPLVYSEAAIKMTNVDFVKRLYDSGASVLPKCDSLFNEDYQNAVVAGEKHFDSNYFKNRNKAIELLMKEGFNEFNLDGTTRMGFDMVLSSKNYPEVEKTLKFCRENNLYIMFAYHLSSGRDTKLSVGKGELGLKIEKRAAINNLIAEIDLGYGIIRENNYNNFITGPCKEYLMIRGNGNVQPCPGNETIIGNVRTHSINELEKILLRDHPSHDRVSFSGNCLYRPMIV